MRRRAAECLLHLAGTVVLIACLTRAQQSREGSEFWLCEEIAQKTLDVAAREWHVDDAFFADYDLQHVVDCASDGDAILLNTSRTIQPRRPVDIWKRLRIRALGETDTLSKATVTCPPNDTLFFIRDVDIVFENISIQNCVFADPFYHRSVVEISCDRSRDEDIVLEMHNVEFSHNSNPGGIAGFRVQDPSCVQIRMRGSTFSRNQYHLGSVFGHRNDLDNITIGENVQYLQPPVINKTAVDEGVSQRMHHTNDPDAAFLQFNNSLDDDAETHALENAVFCFPRMSTSTVKHLVSYNNTGCVVSVDEGSLTIGEDSSFLGNTGVVGAVIVASGSNISVTGTQFQENSYLNSGGCLDLRNESSASINSTLFSRNVAKVSTAIFATSLKRLDINDSHFEQDCEDCGGFILVNHSVDATSAITISNSHLGPFAQFGDERQKSVPRGLLVIDRFHDGHVLLESVDFGRQLTYFAEFTDKGDRVGMVVLMDTRNVSFTSRNSSHTGAGGALSSGFRFVDSSGRFRIEKALFNDVWCYDMGHAIFLRITPYDPVHTKLSVIDSVFSSNFFLGGTIFVTGSNGDVEVRGSQFIDNLVQNDRWYDIPVASILSVSNIKSLYVSNCTAQRNTAKPSLWTTGPVTGSLHIDRTKHVKIEESAFIANSVGTRRGDIGGAVYYSSGGRNSKLEVIDCVFENNFGGEGGAIYARDLWNFDMTGCSFRNNSAVVSGGAVLVAGEELFTFFNDSTFVDNRARIGGAMALGITWRPVIEKCVFSENKAKLYGGAIAFMHIPSMDADLFYAEISLAMSSVEFFKNVAAIGGAVFVDVSVAERYSKEYTGNGHNLFGIRHQSCERLSFTENYASVAGGAIFAKNPEYMALFGLDYEDLTEGRPYQDFAVASSAKNPVHEAVKDNTVGEGGYGPDVATPAIGYYVTLYYKNGTHVPLEQGDRYGLGKWESGDDLPVIEVSMYDHYRQGPARRGSREAKLQPGEMEEVQLPDYLSYARVDLVSSNGLLPNDLVGNLTSGRANITVGPPMVTPGSYTATLIVPDVNEERVTLSVNIRTCVINEVPRDDNRGCIECKPGSYNFDPETETCTVCPDDGDCSGKYVLPKSGHWNAFPCSHHVQRCLHVDACPGNKTTIEKEVLNNDPSNDEATCDLTEDEIEAYKDAECGKEYRGVLCGSCREDYAKIGQSRCRHCQPWALITIFILLSVILLAYTSWQQIGSNLENVKTRWMRRVKRLSTMQRADHVQEALSRAEYSQEEAEIAQKAKEKFVFVLQITLNFMQSMSSGISLELDWTKSIVHLLQIWDGLSGTVTEASTSSFECLLPYDDEGSRSVIQTALTVLIPLFVTAVICTCWVYNTFRLRKPWRYLVQRCILTAVSVLYVSYLSLTETAANVFYCVDVFDAVSLDGIENTTSYWVADTSVRCYVDSHAVLVYALAIPLLIFVVSYPIALAIILVVARRKQALGSEWIQGTIGVLISGFKKEFVYWDCIINIRKALIAVISVFAYKFGSNLQGILTVCVFMLALYLHLTFLPYETDLGPLNFLEGLSLFVSGWTIMVGVILNDPSMTSDIVQLCLVVIVFAMNTCVFVFAGYYLLTLKYTEIKHTLLCEGVDCGSGSSTAVLKSYFAHKTEKIGRSFEKIRTAASSRFGRSSNRYSGDNGASTSLLLSESLS